MAWRRACRSRTCATPSTPPTTSRPVDASPMLHFWSLAVEEQFYLLWPILLLTVARIGRPRLAMAALSTAVLTGSFILCSVLTDTRAPGRISRCRPARGSLRQVVCSRSAHPARSRAARVAAVVGWLGAALLGAISWRSGRRRRIRAWPVAADARRGRPDRFRWGHRVARMDRVREGAAAMARSDLVLAVPVALADPGPRAGGAWPGLAADEGTGDDLAIRVALVALRHRARRSHLGAGRAAVPSRSPRASRRGRGVALAGATALVLVLGSTAIGVVGDREVAAAAPSMRRRLDRRRGLSDGSRRSRGAAVERERVVDGAGGRAPNAVDAGSDSGPRAVPDRLDATVGRAASEAPDRRRSAS